MYDWIDWDSVPEVLTKDQFYRICHISKQTARYLLQSGMVPCEYSGKKTRCYKIKKADVQAYLHKRGVYPERYAAPAGWYGCRESLGLPKKLSPELSFKMRAYYEALLCDYPDVMTVQQIVKLTGYAKTTINDWCCQGRIRSFTKNRTHYIPKAFLSDFFCSEGFRNISRKTKWHIHTIREFQSLLKKESRDWRKVSDNA